MGSAPGGYRLKRISSQVVLRSRCAITERSAVPESERLERLFTSTTGALRPREVVSGLSAVSSLVPIAQFQESGFLVVEDAFRPSEVAAALDGLAAIAGRKNAAFNERMDHPDSAAPSPNEQGAPSFYENRESMIYFENSTTSDSPATEVQPIRKLNGFVAFEPRLAALAEKAGRAAAVLLSAETATLFQDMALLKPPTVGCEKPWHQDHA